MITIQSQFPNCNPVNDYVNLAAIFYLGKEPEFVKSLHINTIVEYCIIKGFYGDSIPMPKVFDEKYGFTWIGEFARQIYTNFKKCEIC